MVTQLDVVLLLELTEQQVAALLERGRRQQGGQAIIASGSCGSRFIEGIRESVAGSAATSTRRRQLRLFFGRQRTHLPLEEASGRPLAEQAAHAPSDGRGRGLRMTTSHRGGNRFQSLPQADQIVFAGLPTDSLIGTAVNEEDAAG